MNEIKIKVEEGVQMPEFKTEGAVGFDLQAVEILKIFVGSKEKDADKVKTANEGFINRGYIKIRENERILFSTGISVDLPDNLELQIRPRSGFSLKKGLYVTNSPGTIDPDYTGTIGVMLSNSYGKFNPINRQESITPFVKIERFERIAQAVPKEITKTILTKVKEISKVTERGTQGYGSTGNK